MPQLPMPAFVITGLNGSIQLTMEKIFGYLEETSHFGGYEAWGTLHIKARGFTANDLCYFTTGELYTFYQQLQACYNSLTGKAILINTECNLELQCEFNKFGHVILTGRFQADHIESNILHFEIKSDQTHIKNTLSQLEAVYDIFGDNKGISQ